MDNFGYLLLHPLSLVQYIMSAILQQRKGNLDTKLAADKVVDKEDNLNFESKTLLQSLVSGYKSSTSLECKSIDAFLLFTIMTGVSQLIYCLLTKGFPYNAFIGVFSASIGSFVFAGKMNILFIIFDLTFLL